MHAVHTRTNEEFKNSYQNSGIMSSTFFLQKYWGHLENYQFLLLAQAKFFRNSSEFQKTQVWEARKFAFLVKKKDSHLGAKIAATLEITLTYCAQNSFSLILYIWCIQNLNCIIGNNKWVLKSFTRFFL